MTFLVTLTSKTFICKCVSSGFTHPAIKSRWQNVTGWPRDLLGENPARDCRLKCSCFQHRREGSEEAEEGGSDAVQPEDSSYQTDGEASSQSHQTEKTSCPSTDPPQPPHSAQFLARSSPWKGSEASARTGCGVTGQAGVAHWIHSPQWGTQGTHFHGCHVNPMPINDATDYMMEPYNVGV